MKKKIIFSCLCFYTFCGLSLAAAQNDQQERRLEEKKRRALDKVTQKYRTVTQRWVFEYGGWMDYQYIDYKNDDNNAALKDPLEKTFTIDTRLWIKALLKPPPDANWDNEHVFYLRIKDAYNELYGLDSFNNYDNDGPHVDYLYGLFDFAPLWIEVGRKYFSIGQGIAYSNVNDGIQLNYKIPGWNIGAFAAHSLPHEDNIDASVPGYDKGSDRYFFGIGAGYAGFKNHQIYGYTLIQRDFSNEDPIAADQQYTYNSEYFGLGAGGRIVGGISYFGEVIRQTGKSQIFGAGTEADVNAWAADVGLEKTFKHFHTPTFSLEYAYGSGDADRADITDTEFGNSSGNDRNFLYFGYVPTGLALAPRLSNLHMYRAGLAWNPWEDIRILKDMQYKINFYRFFKDKKEGAILDLEATESSLDVGYEFDIELKWQMLSDVDMSVEYGHFVPGDAYPATDNNNEEYFSVSLTHTF